MRKINNIVLHCSATAPGANFTVEKLRHTHVDVNGWSDIGYHFYITRDGVTHPCRPISRPGAHVKGHNGDSIGICLEGGVDKAGSAEFNYTEEQMAAARATVVALNAALGTSITPKGHRDFSPDLNGDGTIQANEYIKECPCFGVVPWWEGVM